MLAIRGKRDGVANRKTDECYDDDGDDGTHGILAPSFLRRVMRHCCVVNSSMHVTCQLRRARSCGFSARREHGRVSAVVDEEGALMDKTRRPGTGPRQNRGPYVPSSPALAASGALNYRQGGSGPRGILREVATDTTSLVRVAGKPFVTDCHGRRFNEAVSRDWRRPRMASATTSRRFWPRPRGGPARGCPPGVGPVDVALRSGDGEQRRGPPVDAMGEVEYRRARRWSAR